MKKLTALILSVLLVALVPTISAQEQSTEKPQRTSIPVDPKVVGRYVGRYQVGPNRIMNVTLEDGHVFTQMTGQQRIEIFPENEHVFFVKQFDAQLTFHTDDQGTATDFVLHQAGRDVTCNKIVYPTAASLQPKLTEIDSMTAADFAQRPVGSATVGVVSGNELIWTKTYGNADMDKKIPADKDTVYRIGSITKMFTAVMLEQLVESGKVHYSDPAEKYFPEVKTILGRYPNAPPITLVQLATHTAGLSAEPDTPELYAAGGPPSAWEKKLIAALPHTHYEYEPGTHYSYSNIGFAILGAALSRAAGESYMEYVPKHILAPLGMTHSGLERTEAMAPHLAKGYQASRTQVDAVTPEREQEGRGYKMPNGAMYTTVGDIARFASFLLGEGPQTVLKPGSMSRWLDDSVVAANSALTSGYGHGFEVTRRDNYVAVGHSGAVAGYGAALFMNRKTGVAVIVLASSLGTPLNPTGIAMRALDNLSK